MKTQDKIMKAFLNSVESIKDTAERNIVAAVSGKHLTVQKESLPGLILLVKNAVDDGFQKSHNSVSKSIANIIAEDTKGVEDQSKSARKTKKSTD